MLGVRGVDEFRRVALVDDGQAATVFIVAFVLAFLVERQEAVELHDLAGGAKHRLAVVGRDFDRCALKRSGFHLRGDGALPDELIKTRHIRFEMQVAGAAVEVGGAHGLVGFLRVLGFRRVTARAVGQVVLAIVAADGGTGGGVGFFGHLHAIGTHVGDEADLLAADLHAFVEALGDLHRAAGGEAELAGGFLLQRGGGERRGRVTLDRLRLDRGDAIGAGFHRREGAGGGFSVRQRELLQLLAIEFGEAGFELAAIHGEPGLNLPVFLRDEALDLELAIDDDTKRDRLHATCRARAGQLAPENWREREADEIVEGAAGQIGVDQLLVDLARVLDCFGDGLLGDRVERHALDRLALQHLAGVERFKNVPRDRFPFAIRVGCEDQAVGILHRVGDFLDVLDRFSIDVPRHREVLVGLHGTVL